MTTSMPGGIYNYNNLESRYAYEVYELSDNYLVEILKQNDKFWTYFLWMTVATTWHVRRVKKTGYMWYVCLCTCCGVTSSPTATLRALNSPSLGLGSTQKYSSYMCVKKGRKHCRNTSWLSMAKGECMLRRFYVWKDAQSLCKEFWLNSHHLLEVQLIRFWVSKDLKECL